MNNRKSGEIEQTPATLPTSDGEYAITLNGRILRESDRQFPSTALNSLGVVWGDGMLGDEQAAVGVYVSSDGREIERVRVMHLRNDSWFEDYELRKSDEQPDTGEQWETRRFDPEATVEIRPVSEMEV